MHIDPHNPYGRLTSFKRPNFSLTPRAWPYTALAVVVVASLVWTNQKAQAINQTSQKELASQQASFATARAQALKIGLYQRRSAHSRHQTSQHASARYCHPNVRRSQTARSAEPRCAVTTRLRLPAGKSTSRRQNTLEAAKAVDPGYPTTYQLLAVTYAKTGNAKPL